MMESNERNNDALQPYTYDRNLNWYFNAANLPNQKAAFATKDFIEQHRAAEITVEQFFNLLFRQKDLIGQYLDKPFDYLAHLQSIPLSDALRHTLYGMLLYWFGGSPDALMAEDSTGQNVQTILKLILAEFQKQFPADATPEKTFCDNEPTQRLLRETKSSLQAEFNKQGAKIKIAHSQYLDHIDIEFGDLPAYIIDKAIVRKYERENRMQDNEYRDWWSGLQDFINTVPQVYRELALEKGIEYGQKCYDYHLAKECNKPTSCSANESWERRITIATGALQQYTSVIEIADQPVNEQLSEQETKNPEFTTARQVLALHYIFELLQVRGTETDKAAKERFAQFLTGKSKQNIHAAFTDPHITPKTKTFRFDDLQFIRKYFEDLGLSEIVKAINNQLEKPR